MHARRKRPGLHRSALFINRILVVVGRSLQIGSVALRPSYYDINKVFFDKRRVAALFATNFDPEGPDQLPANAPCPNMPLHLRSVE